MNWKNSFHDILMLSFGQAFTVDEAYRVLHEMREDRLFAIASAFAESKRAQAKVVAARQSLSQTNVHTPKSMRRRSEAFLIETQARTLIAQPCLDMARAELAFIESCIKHVADNNLRIYKNFVEGCQLIQPMESAYELTWALALGGDATVLRNSLVHPHSDHIHSTLGALQDVERTELATVISHSLGQRFGLRSSDLSITVNTQQLISDNLYLLEAYTSSSENALEKLNGVGDEIQRIGSGS